MLGYVYLENGRMLNEEIIKAGYASPMTIPLQCEVPGQILETLQRSTRSPKRVVHGIKFKEGYMALYLPRPVCPSLQKRL
jgi:hypothetical protein